MKRSFSLLVFAVAAAAQAQWSSYQGHYYMAVYTPSGQELTFEQARAAAQATIAPNGLHADLVSCNTADENDFAFSLVDDPKFWYANSFNANIGPWIGLYQPGNAGDFVWVDGTSVSYSRWWSGEPNDSGGIEQYGHFYSIPAPNRSANWNDLGPSVLTNGYVVEAVPEPASCAALGLGTLALIKRGRPRRSGGQNSAV